MATDEDDHALEHVARLGEIRRVPCVSLGVDIFQRDLAAGLPVIRDEARARRIIPTSIRPEAFLGIEVIQSAERSI